jgi:hypothetical protein
MCGKSAGSGLGRLSTIKMIVSDGAIMRLGRAPVAPVAASVIIGRRPRGINRFGGQNGDFAPSWLGEAV